LNLFFYRSISVYQIKSHFDEDIISCAIKFLSSQKIIRFNKYGNSEFHFPSNKTLPSIKRYNHYSIASSCQPWFFCQYRLPNHILACSFLLLLTRTGWNISSVGRLTTENFNTSLRGVIEIQAPKYKTEDDTPIYEVNRGDMTWSNGLTQSS